MNRPVQPKKAYDMDLKKGINKPGKIPWLKTGFSRRRVRNKRKLRFPLGGSKNDFDIFAEEFTGLMINRQIT